jgi:hypothetical protein
MDLNAVYPRVSCTGKFDAGDGVRTALRAATAVRPLQLEARCTAASEHFAIRNFHIYCHALLKLCVRNLQKMSVGV